MTDRMVSYKLLREFKHNSSLLPFNSPSGHGQNNLDSSFGFRRIAGRRGRVNLFTWGGFLFILFYFFKP